MFRRRIARHEAAKIDDALDTRGRGRAREVVGGADASNAGGEPGRDEVGADLSACSAD
jgi:hypothetical protein